METFVTDLEKIRTGGRHLLALVNGVLDLSKIEAGKMELYSEEFGVCAMVRGCGDDGRAAGDKSGTTRLNVDCPADIGNMYADLTKVRQILFNLLSNAAKFTENGEVTIEVRRDEVGAERRG